MADTTHEELASETVDRRLRELAQLYELGIALREARFVEEGAPEVVSMPLGPRDLSDEGSRA